MEKVKAFADWLTKWFTVIVIVWAVFNYFVPAASLWGKAYTGYMLGIVLFGMGLTLTLDDFKRILTQPLMVIVGTVAHFIIMPLIAVALCAIFHLSGPLAVGVILVGCCPSGTSSNVMSYLSRGDVALDVSIGILSTLCPGIQGAFLLSFEKPASGVMIFGFKALLPIPSDDSLTTFGLKKTKARTSF